MIHHNNECTVTVTIITKPWTSPWLSWWYYMYLLLYCYHTIDLHICIMTLPKALGLHDDVEKLWAYSVDMWTWTWLDLVVVWKTNNSIFSSVTSSPRMWFPNDSIIVTITTKLVSQAVLCHWRELAHSHSLYRDCLPHSDSTQPSIHISAKSAQILTKTSARFSYIPSVVYL